VVDGVQGVGVLPLALDGVDALAVGGHKWLCGTEGAGFLYTSERLLDVATPRNVSWHSVATDLSVPGREVAVEPGLPPLKAGAERFEEGTPNTYGNVMLGAAATMLAELGVARVWDRVRGLLDELVERVRAKGYTVASSLAPDERSGIVALGHPAHDPDELVARLKAAGIVAIHRGAWLRLSPHFYNNSADLDRLCEVLP
jgi:selenocysteine lyase/cysteine desulfurase